MKGFLIEIHNNKISAVVDRGIVVITANTANISITVDIASMSLNWGKLILRKGDKIKIIASEIEKVLFLTIPILLSLWNYLQSTTS